jgi:hypothetical protein
MRNPSRNKASRDGTIRVTVEAAVCVVSFDPDVALGHFDAVVRVGPASEHNVARQAYDALD